MIELFNHHIFWNNESYFKPTKQLAEKTLAKPFKKERLIIEWLTYNRGTVVLILDHPETHYTYLKERGYGYFLYPNSVLDKSKRKVIYEVIPDIWLNELVNRDIKGIKSLTSQESQIYQNQHLVKNLKTIVWPTPLNNNNYQYSNLTIPYYDLCSMGPYLYQYGVGLVQDSQISHSHGAHIWQKTHLTSVQMKEPQFNSGFMIKREDLQRVKKTMRVKVKFPGQLFRLEKWFDGTTLPPQYKNWFVVGNSIPGVTNAIGIHVYELNVPFQLFLSRKKLKEEVQVGKNLKYQTYDKNVKDGEMAGFHEAIKAYYQNKENNPGNEYCHNWMVMVLKEQHTGQYWANTYNLFSKYDSYVGGMHIDSKQLKETVKQAIWFTKPTNHMFDWLLKNLILYYEMDLYQGFWWYHGEGGIAVATTKDEADSALGQPWRNYDDIEGSVIKWSWTMPATDVSKIGKEAGDNWYWSEKYELYRHNNFNYLIYKFEDKVVDDKNFEIDCYVNVNKGYSILLRNNEVIQLGYGLNKIKFSNVYKTDKDFTIIKITNEETTIENIYEFPNGPDFISQQLERKQLDLMQSNINKTKLEQTHENRVANQQWWSNLAGGIGQILSLGGAMGMITGGFAQSFAKAGAGVTGLTRMTGAYGVGQGLSAMAGGGSGIANSFLSLHNFKYEQEIRDANHRYTMDSLNYQRQTLAHQLDMNQPGNASISSWDEFCKFYNIGQTNFVIYEHTASTKNQEIYQYMLLNLGLPTNYHQMLIHPLSEVGVYQFSQFMEWSTPHLNEIRTTLLNPFKIVDDVEFEAWKDLNSHEQQFKLITNLPESFNLNIANK